MRQEESVLEIWWGTFVELCEALLLGVMWLTAYSLCVAVLVWIDMGLTWLWDFCVSLF